MRILEEMIIRIKKKFMGISKNIIYMDEYLILI